MTTAADISVCMSFVLCAVWDIYSQRIPNVLLILIIAIGAFFFGPYFLLRTGLSLGVAYLLYRLAGRYFPNLQPGGGDLKLLCIAVGWYAFDAARIAFIGLAAAAVYGIVMMLLHRRRLSDGIPIAPFMLIGFMGYRIMEATV